MKREGPEMFGKQQQLFVYKGLTLTFIYKCVVRDHIGVIEEDPILCSGSTKADVTPTLP